MSNLTCSTKAALEVENAYGEGGLDTHRLVISIRGEWLSRGYPSSLMFQCGRSGVEG